MSYRETAARFTALVHAAEALDTPLPAALVAAVAAAESTYPTLPDPSPAALAAAVRAAAEAGRDPFTDKTVTAELNRRTNGVLVAQILDNLRAGAIEAALTEHAPTIIDAWHPRVAELGAAIAQCSDELPGVPFLTRADVVAAGTGAHRLDLWSAAHAAATALNNAAGTLFGLVNPSPYNRPLIGAQLNPDQLDQLDQLGHGKTWWSGAVIGQPLDLADADTLTDRTERVTTERQRAAEALSSAASRRFFGGVN